MCFRDIGLCCYLTRWLTPDTLKNGAMAGAMFETFVINEILKSYSNEGLEYDFDVYSERMMEEHAARQQEYLKALGL